VIIPTKKSSRNLSWVLSEPKWPLRGLWLLTWHIPTSILVFWGSGGKIRARWILWTRRHWWFFSWFHFFILRTRYLIFRIATVQIYNHVTYLIGRQKTNPFPTRSLSKLSCHNRQQHTSPFQEKLSNVCILLFVTQSMENFLLLSLKNLLACYTKPNWFMV
jgi:hypothetical protein